MCQRRIGERALAEDGNVWSTAAVLIWKVERKEDGNSPLSNRSTFSLMRCRGFKEAETFSHGRLMMQ